jgi:arabinogalactan endo-1,4-beta-galactosidase
MDHYLGAKSNKMRIPTSLLLLSLLLLGFSGCKDDSSGITPTAKEIIRGADLSFVPEIEEAGTKFYNANGSEEDILSQLSNAGCNLVRVRLWHSPSNNHSGLSEVAALCQRVKQKGMKVMLDIHYSDTWADPGKQETPTAWKNLSLNTLTDSVYNYTSVVLSLIRPEYVQIGNEINSGFLWDQGKISNEAAFVQLLKAGVKASRDVVPNTRIILHFAGMTGSEWFFGMLKTNNVDYDVMALSYYPIWHGKDIALVDSTMYRLVNLTTKEVMIVETSYPFTLEWNDYTTNIIGANHQILPDFPATETGQLAYMKQIKGMVKRAYKGIGFVYWGGEWVAFKGSTSTDGSSWENQALFDFNNKGLPVMEAFNK